MRDVFSKSNSRPKVRKLSESEKIDEARKIAEAEKLLAKEDAGDPGQRVIGAPTAPIAVRFSEPILKRLDEVAAQQHRTRSNLIQFIVREYLSSQ